MKIHAYMPRIHTLKDLNSLAISFWLVTFPPTWQVDVWNMAADRFTEQAPGELLLFSNQYNKALRLEVGYLKLEFTDSMYIGGGRPLFSLRIAL